MSIFKKVVRHITSVLIMLLLSASAAFAEAGAPEMTVIPGKNFEIGKFEVTQGEWKAVMDNNPSNFSNCGDNCPVEKVSWNDAQEFIQKLNAKTGKQYRLPTEAEWEYACHGSQRGDYCGGNDPHIVGWYHGNSGEATHPVGQKKANSLGIHDMSGNVWEWTQDCYDTGCNSRVLRGGSWYYFEFVSRAAFRYYDDPNERSKLYGFRVARTLP